MRKLLAGGIVLFALLGLFVSTYTLIDPVSAQLANDNDPFGEPPPAKETLYMLLKYTLLLVVGCSLWKGKRKEREI